MANADAQFIFETNLPQVRQEIQTELGRISAAVAESSGAQGGDFLGGLTKGLTGDVSRAIAEIRRIKAEAEEAVTSGGTIATGKAPAAMQFNDVITGLQKQVEDRVRKAALSAGSDLGQLDLRAIMAEIDQAFTKKARDQARALVRDIERTGTPQAQAIYGSSRDIPTGVPRTTLTTPADVQQQAADEKRARRESAAAARRLAKSTDANAAALDEQTSDTQQETSQRRGRRRRLATSEDALAAANEQAAASTKDAANQKVVKVDLAAAQQTDSRRVLKGITSGDPNFGYATRTGAPGTNVVDRSDPSNLRFFREIDKGSGYEEIEHQTPRYARLLSQENARLEKQQQAEAQAEAQRLAAMQANTQRLLAGMDTGASNIGYVTKSGAPGKYAFEGLDADTASIYKNTGTKDAPQFEEVNRSSKEFAQVQDRLRPILEQLRGVLEQRIQALQVAAQRDLETAAEEAILKAALSQRIRNSLLNQDNEYRFNTPGNSPSKEVYNTSSGDLLRENSFGGYDQITEADADYVRARRRHTAAVAKNATQDQAEGEQVDAATRAYVESLKVKALLAASDRSAQYLTDSGRPNARVAVGPDGGLPTDPQTARYFERRGDNFVELQAGDQRYTDSQRLLTDQIRDRTTAEDRARTASTQYAESLRKSSAGAGGTSGGGGFGGGFSTGLFSGGFGDSGENGTFGLGRSLGQTVKYSLAYKAFNDLLMIMGQVSQEFLNVDDSVVELQYAMADGSDVTTEFINRLQGVAAPGGFNVGDAMDQAAASIRAYRDEINAATDATGQLLDQAGRQQLAEDVGTNFAKAATQVAVIAKTNLADAAQNNRATALGFNLDPATAGGRIADAISNAKLSGGGIESDISQGGANIAEIAHTAGFSLEEALNVVSKLSAKLDESGQLAATRFSRMVGTLQGSAGKNFLTQLNQSLPVEQQINVNASPRDQILQIAAAYNSLNEAQKQQLSTAIGGQAQQREFNVLVSSFPQLAKDAANSQVGLADREYQDRLNNVRGLLGQIRGELRNIVTNLATSGVLAPFAALLKILEPILGAVRSITAAFDRIPSVIRDIGGALLAVYATVKGITALRAAGEGSIVAGISSFARGAERIVRPDAALARQELELTGNHNVDYQTHVVAPADQARDIRFGQIAQQVQEGALSMGAASKARLQAEADYKQAIRANEADYRRAAKAGTSAVEEGGNDLRNSFKRLRGDEIGNNLKDLRTGINAGGEQVLAALKRLALVIAEGTGQVAVGGVQHLEQGLVNGRLGGAATLVEDAEGGGFRAAVNGSRLGRGVAAVGGAVGGAARGAGALAASELGPLGIGLIATDLGLQLKSAFDQIGDAQRSLASASSIDVNAGAQALSDAAKANEEAAKQMREASGGFFGSIANFLQGGGPGAAANRADEVAGQQQALADHLQLQQKAATTQTGAAALASQIDTSSGDSVNTSVKNLLDAGQTASSVLDAITLSLKSLKFAANGTVGDLTSLQQADLAGRLGIAAGAAAPDRISEINAQIDAAKSQQQGNIDPKVREAAKRREADLQAQLNAFSPGSQFGNDNGSTVIDNRVSGIATRFFQQNSAASLSDPKVQQQLYQTIGKQLRDRYGIDAQTSAMAALAAMRALPAEREKQLTQLATPEVAAALVQQGISTSALEGDTATQNSKLQSLRTGTPDRSASAGLAVQHQRLQVLVSTVQGDIAAEDAKDPTGKLSSALRLQLAVAQNALVQTEVKQAEQLVADAKSDIDDAEKRRIARQGAATSVAAVKKIGDDAIADELGKAIKTMDPDLLASVVARASDEELDNFKRFLAQKLATDAALIEAEKKAEIAAGLLNSDGTPTQDRPSPLAPGTPNPADSLPGFLQRKKTLPKPLQDLLNKQGSAQAAYDLYVKIMGETTNTGAAATGSDVPGGTIEEKQAAAAAAQAEKDRNSSEAATAKVQAAKAAMDKISDHGSQEYFSAQQQYYAALNAQADLQQDKATSEARAALFPGDKVRAAKLALDDATNQVARFGRDSKEYWDAVAKQKQAQVDYAAAQRDQAYLVAQTKIDLTDPVAVANAALKNARDKLAYDQAHSADTGTLAQDKIDVTNKQNSAESAAFQQRLSDAQTADQLGTISHAAYIRYLQNESARLHSIKGKTRQQIDEMNEIDKDLKAANSQLSGQFNLGDIKVPSVYEVRRSIQAQAAGLSANAISTTAVANTTNNVTVNGADFAKVLDYLNKVFGKTARITTTPRKA